MKYLILILCCLILIIWGCSNDNKNNPVSPPQGSGKIQLTIDKANAPSDVVMIEAILTRSGYDPITGMLNLLSDSTADILLEDIQAGTWHLRVDAVDSSNVLLYTGETDVLIMAGFTTQVSLVLEPTGEGTGNVHIYVTWGTITNNWSDFNANPILVPSGSFYETHGVGQAKILFIDGIYKMWYTGDAGGSNKYVMYAESNDGISWNRPFAPPVLSPGLPGTWDDLSVAPGAVMYDEGTYLMYYCGWTNPYANWNIGLATSTDGINWTKHPNPVLYSGSGWEFQLGPSSIIKIDNVYYLYYYGRNLPVRKIALATSTDGINWTRHPSNPIIVADQSWEGTGLFWADVYKKNNRFEMIYMNAIGTAFGRAISTDGISWIKDETNPFFTTDETYNHWADSQIAYPFFINVNDKDRIYYTGFPSSGPFKIGFVSK